MTYFFLGAPESGKGTQATKLAQVLQIPYFTMGGYLRERAKSDPAMAEVMNRGDLLPSETINRILGELHEAYPDNLIIEGAARTAEQATAIATLWGDTGCIFIFLTISDETIRQRAALRRAPDGTRRADDAPEVVETRIQHYQETMPPILDAIRQSGVRIVTIDGEPDPETIHQTILSEITA